MRPRPSFAPPRLTVTVGWKRRRKRLKKLNPRLQICIGLSASGAASGPMALPSERRRAPHGDRRAGWKWRRKHLKSLDLRLQMASAPREAPDTAPGDSLARRDVIAAYRPR